MNLQQIILGLCTTTLCLSMIACGGDQKRTKIGDRSGARSKLKNSKLLKTENIIMDCSSDSGNKKTPKKILSLVGLAESLTTPDAAGMFASSFTNRIRMTDSNNNDLKNRELFQTYLVEKENGLQYNSDTLSTLAPSLLRVVVENCNQVHIPAPKVGEDPSLFFQMARLNPQDLSQFVQTTESLLDLIETEGTNLPDNLVQVEDAEINSPNETVAEAPETSTAQVQPGNSIPFTIDLQASSEKILVLINPANLGRIIIKVLGDETIQVTTESKNQTLEACGKSYTFDLRNEATLVWGKSQHQPVSIDFELYDNMLNLANNPELLSNGKTETVDGRRAEGSSIQSVSLPVLFIGEFDKSLKLYREGKQKNPFDIHPPNCSGDTEATNPTTDADTSTSKDNPTNEEDSSKEEDEGNVKEAPDFETIEV